MVLLRYLNLQNAGTFNARKCLITALFIRKKGKMYILKNNFIVCRMIFVSILKSVNSKQVGIAFESFYSWVLEGGVENQICFAKP